MADEPDTSGTPPTVHSFEPTSDDSTVTEEQRKAIDEALMKRWGGTAVHWNESRYSWWLFWTKTKHLVGLHTYIPLEVWDRDAGSITFEGNRCWICNEEGA